MKSKRAQRHFPWVAAVVLASALQFGIYPLSGAGLKTLYYSSIGAARFDGGAFRTVFHFTNEASDARTGRLQFSSVAGGSLNVTLAQTWSGTRGTLETSTGLAVFTLPGKSALELIVALPVPSLPNQVGWARAEIDDDVNARAYLQATRRESDAQSQDFENLVEREVEVYPTAGVKQFSFPLFLYAGFGDIRTAFSVVNVSASAGTVRFTLRPGTTRTLVLRPGEVVADYFERFWQVAFPAVFPLRVSGTADVESDVPLAVTVLRTAGPLPLSGVPIAVRTAPGSDVEGVLGREFTLSINQTAVIAAEKLRITFWDIVEDSRCPIDAICIQLGRAAVALRVSRDGQSLGDLRLSTEPASSVVQLDRYTVTLHRVEPSRRSDQIPLITDYRVALTVR